MAISASIIITTRNRAAHLRETLASFHTLRVPDGWRVELLVVDNGSTDDTAQVIDAARLPQLSVRRLLEPRPGQCHARNAGMANTAGDIILFTDDDVRVPANWVEGMCAPIVEGAADAVAGGVSLPPHLLKPWMEGVHLGWLACSGDWKPEEITLTGANMAFSRRVLEKVPAFDTELGPGALGFSDDTLFSLQLGLAGFVLTRRYEVAVEHWFDESRLQRSTWLETARKRGRTRAYLAHHWYHSTNPARRRRLAIATLRLFKWRALNQQRVTAEGCAEEELWLVRSVHFWKQLLVEQRRPRKYSHRGLVKSVSPQ